MPHPSSYVLFARKLSSAALLALVLASAAFSDGLPGEYLVTQRWRALNNPYSPLSNPANIAEENYIAVRAAVAPVLQGAYTLFEVGANVPISLYQTAGFTMLIEDGGEVYGSKEDENGSGRIVENKDSPLRNNNLLFSFGYAWHAWRRLIVGANLNIAYQSNFDGDPLYGVGIDLGAAYRLYKHPVLGEHIVGIATQNLIAPSMGATDGESFSEYPRNLRLTGYSKFWESRIENYLEFDLKDFFAKADNFVQNTKNDAGMVTNNIEQLATSMEWELNWRIGYWAMRMFKAYLILGFDDNVLGHWGLALGAQMPSFNRGRDLSIYYQYNVMTEDNSDATSHSFYAKADFGRHREEEFARRVARMASLNPNELYNRGRKLYAEGKYWEAFFVFSRLMVEFPDFFKNDWVSLFRSDCQEQLDMRERAIDNYNKVKEAYPSGEVVPYADLGLMRIYYRNNEFPQATNQFVELNKPGVPDSLRFHGTYIMGQIYLQNGELRKALQAFSVIPDTHPDYIFAQHAAAVTHAVLGSDIKDVIAALENAINTAPKTKQAQEMVNRSYLFMGFIFYEENALSKAVTALRTVPSNSSYYEDALLGLAWTGLKARQWNDCISVGKTLQNTTQQPVLRAEGLLLQAYGHMLQKEYPKSLELLKSASALCEKLEAPLEDSLNVRTLRYDNNRMAYSQLADRVEEYSQIGQTSHLAGVLDSLKNKSSEFVKGFHEHQRYRYEYQRSSFFSRTIDQVKEDVEYAMAKVQKIMGVGGASGSSGRKAAEQTKELDAEIEKLKKEMGE